MTSEKIKAVIKQWLKCHDCDITTPEECDKCGEELPEGEFVKALNEAVKILGERKCKMINKLVLNGKPIEEWKDYTNLACEDAISKKEVFSILTRLMTEAGKDGKLILSDAKEMIGNLPSVTPQQTSWIPVSERLPEDYIHVLCQFTLGGMGECYLAHGVFHVVGGLVMTCNEVIAWMPLPERYERGDADERTDT